MLFCAKKISRPAQAQIGFRQFEAIRVMAKSFETFSRQTIPLIRVQNTERLAFSPADTSTQLMQLGQTEALRIHNQHERSVGVVYPDLNNRRTDQDLNVATHEGGHGLLFFICLDLAMQEGHATISENIFLQPLIAFLG